MSNAALTQGVHHVGLTVRELYATRDFFVNCLGWSQVGEKPDYPAVFVFDGYILVTLWKVKDQAHMREFDRRSNVGLHHLALRAKSEEAFREIVKRVERWSGVRIEFPRSH